MKIDEIPKNLLRARATPIPTRAVPDWDALYTTMLRKGYVIIDEGELYASHSSAALQNTMVKAFNCHVRGIRNERLRTKRIGVNRWFCCL